MKHIALALAFVLVGSIAEAQTFPLPLNQYSVDGQASTDGTASFAFNAPKKALLSLTVKAAASAGFAMVLDAAALPANGALGTCGSTAATRPCVMWCAPVAANGFVFQQWSSPLAFTTGVLVAFSTTGCTNLTASNTALIFGQAL